MPVQELQEKTTATEFVMWNRFLELDQEIPSKQDLYLAQIATEGRRGWVDKPKLVSIEEFILKPTSSKEAPVEKAPVKQTTLKASKAFWLGNLGLKEA